MDEILSLLEKLNFSKTEAAVYVNLVKFPGLSGYQVARNLNISRSSVYSSLDNLVRKGIVFLIPGDTQVYKAEDPANLINKMKHDFNETADALQVKLSELQTPASEERFLNIEGYDNVVSKTKELLLTAEKEVYLNTDFDLQVFAKELTELKKRKVRVIAFSFSKLDTHGLDVEAYTHDRESCTGHSTRMMLVVDCKTALVADKGHLRGEFVGTFTDNTLFTSIVGEHIHIDIYLLKLKNKYRKDLIDDTIKLNTVLENR
ncbi:MAG: helix-turn-helix domain-containing protein [Clostridiaceae bacterium]